VQDRDWDINRVQMNLEDANIKLASVVTDIRGSVECPPERCWSHSSLRNEMPMPSQIWCAGGCVLSGTNRQRRYKHILPPTPASSDRHLVADRKAVALLDTIPAVSQRSTAILLAEIGTDMTRFPNPEHLASWAGTCPGHHQSGSEGLSGKTRMGNRCLRQVLVDVADPQATI
jgi:transposase